MGSLEDRAWKRFSDKSNLTPEELLDKEHCARLRMTSKFAMTRATLSFEEFVAACAKLSKRING